MKQLVQSNTHVRSVSQRRNARYYASAFLTFVGFVVFMALFSSCFNDLHLVLNAPDSITLSAISLEGAEADATYAVVGSLLGGYPRYESEYADTTNESILRIRTDGEGNGTHAFTPERVFKSLRGDDSTLSIVVLRGGIPDWDKVISGKDINLLRVWNASNLDPIDPTANPVPTFTLTLRDFVPTKNKAHSIVFTAD